MTDIIQYIDHPEMLDRTSLFELRGLLARYPYYQTARLLLLKNLYLLHDASFGDELRKAALFVNDRRILFQLVEGENYIIPKNKKRTSSESLEQDSDRTLSLIDGFLDNIPEVDEASASKQEKKKRPVDYASDYISYLMQMDDIAPVDGDEESSKMHGQDLIDGFIENGDEHITLNLAPQRKKNRHAHKFGTNVANIDSDDDELDNDDITEDGAGDIEVEMQNPVTALDVDSGSKAVQTNATDLALNIVDELGSATNDNIIPDVKFEKAVKIEKLVEVKDVKVSQIENPTAVEEPNETEDNAIFTETLAKIYIKQQRYDKALEIIKKLSLKYPKKNRYFADQIRFLEKLIINSK